MFVFIAGGVFRGRTKEDKITRKNAVRTLVLGTVTAVALASTACGGSKKGEITAAKQEFSAGTRAGGTIKAGKSKMDETTKTGETKADASKKDDRAADARESMMAGTFDEVKDFAFTSVDEKGTVYQFTFEQSKAPEGLSDIKAGDKITVTCTDTTPETNPFEGMVVSVKEV